MARRVGFVLVFVGLFLLFFGLFERFYAYPRLKKAPLDQYSSPVATGTGTYFNRSPDKLAEVDRRPAHEQAHRPGRRRRRHRRGRGLGLLQQHDRHRRPGRDHRHPGADRPRPGDRPVGPVLRREPAPPGPHPQVPVRHREDHLPVLGRPGPAGPAGGLHPHRDAQRRRRLPVRAAHRPHRRRRPGDPRVPGRRPGHAQRPDQHHLLQPQDPLGRAGHRHHRQGPAGRHPGAGDPGRRAGPDPDRRRPHLRRGHRRGRTPTTRPAAPTASACSAPSSRSPPCSSA